MLLIEVILLALGLALDAFAVSLAATASGKIDNKRAVFRLSFHFGLFQFLMPVIGWAFGERVAPYITTFDNWIAFSLLLIVGIKMIVGSLRGEEGLTSGVDPSRGFNLIMLSLATSIDALAVGFSLAIVRIDIWYPSVIIGIITAAMSLIGIQLGNIAGRKLGRYLAAAGGIILIVIGLKFLVD